jgi:hypothetical protein
MKKIDHFHSFVHDNIDPKLEGGFKFAIENMLSALQ